MRTAPTPSRHRSRRLRKKLRIGEFMRLGFSLSITLRARLSVDEADAFWDFFIGEVERLGLQYGGLEEGFVCSEFGSATEQERAALLLWLNGRQEVAASFASPLTDSCYDSKK